MSAIYKGEAGLDHTHGFLRSTLDVSPSKQFLKVGSPVECSDHSEEYHPEHHACEHNSFEIARQVTRGH